MIKSMTGFGSGMAECDHVMVSAEIRALNSRYLEFNIKLPHYLSTFEGKVQKCVKEVCQRGQITIIFSIEVNSSQANGKVKFDRDKYETYENILQTINQDYGKEINIADVLNLDSLLMSRKKPEVTEKLILDSVNQALTQLIKMRNDEGKAISKDLKKRIKSLSASLGRIEKLHKQSSQNIFTEYRSKIVSLMENHKVEESRILQEAAVLSEKMDIIEECVRCRSHMQQLASALDENEPVGKKMNFILQEIYREINTISSKTSQLKITEDVIKMKDEVEKIREQVQNII
jgi:uncharacterized protein (TIGR00255 family)|tara:strand:+ start:118 stop:984 length:867 start_codon:yes stop_codon:yes gene_type:complete